MSKGRNRFRRSFQRDWARPLTTSRPRLGTADDPSNQKPPLGPSEGIPSETKSTTQPQTQSKQEVAK